MKTLRLIAVILFFASCSGGGGGDSSSSLPGVWTANLKQTINTCNEPLAGTDFEVNPIYQVNVSNGNVVVENLASKYTLTGGTIDDGTGFAVTAAIQPNCVGGSASAVLGFQNVHGKTAGDVIFDVDVQCPNTNPKECEWMWEGSALKQ